MRAPRDSERVRSGRGRRPRRPARCGLAAGRGRGGELGQRASTSQPGVERLGHDVDRAELEQVDEVLLVVGGQRGDHHDRRRPSAVERPQHLPPVEHRHHHVEQHQVGRRRGSIVARARPRRRRPRVISWPSGRQLEAQEQADVGVVVDDRGRGSREGAHYSTRTAPGRRRSADLDRPVALGAQHVERAVGLLGRHHHDHADAEVEDLQHLLVGHLAEALDLAEDPRRLPRAGGRATASTPSGSTRDEVAGQAAAGDVGDRLARRPRAAGRRWPGRRSPTGAGARRPGCAWRPARPARRGERPAVSSSTLRASE